MRRQHGMPLDHRIVSYLQMTGLYHLAKLNETWFRFDEPLVNAFVERWHSKKHTFYMPFGDCMIMLQDVVYYLGLPIDDQYVSGCLRDFERHIEGGRAAWDTFSELPQGTNNEMVRRYARAYIMMLLSTQLFRDKSSTRLHIHPLATLRRQARGHGSYSGGSAALSWLYMCMCHVANRNIIKLAGPLQLLQSWIFWRFPSFWLDGFDFFHWPLASRWLGYQPTLSDKGPLVVHYWRLRIDLLHPRDVSGALCDIGAMTYGVVEGRDNTDLFCCHRVASGGSDATAANRAEHVLQFDVVLDKVVKLASLGKLVELT
ncbi:hypothetical protein Ahy_B05g074994 [Arachis hypogaea]|uniref:Aminotransferase-like plant mobile domain-containing protein n=1 Tax=Arachis hypogaea TaxID=3818 RepID=A0A444Z0M4_ARAHY|nr:hypothetical protein Ahy_B05g074994 [Arachis hypogaea]